MPLVLEVAVLAVWQWEWFLKIKQINKWVRFSEKKLYKIMKTKFNKIMNKMTSNKLKRQKRVKRIKIKKAKQRLIIYLKKIKSRKKMIPEITKMKCNRLNKAIPSKMKIRMITILSLRSNKSKMSLTDSFLKPVNKG